MADRFPEGIVLKDAYEDFREKLISKLKKLKDPDSGESVFEDVLTRKEAFGEAADDGFPDIQLVTREAKYDVLGKIWNGNDRDEKPCVTTEQYVRSANGMHRPKGIFFIYGASINDGVAAQGLHLTDICPTALALTAVPIPVDLDGRVIKEIISDAFLKTHPLQWEAATTSEAQAASTEEVYSHDETSMIMDNLKSLGYME
jgi:predicted AlkP superfamily phosphohydrolase/phosphomutase